METTRLSTKGQIILPKSIRDSREWGPGTEFTVEDTGDGILLRPARPFPPATIEEVFGSLKTKRKKHATLAEMDAAIQQELESRRDRHRY